MEENRFESFLIVLVTIFVFIFSILRKKKESKETHKIEKPKPVVQSESSRTSCPSFIHIKDAPVIKNNLSSSKPQCVKSQAYIHRVMNRLYSKKDMIYLSEILYRKEDF